MLRPVIAAIAARPLHVGGLALVGRHAERRVALQVLDRAEILARRKLDVLHGHVVLEVDPLAALGAGPWPCRLDAIGLVGCCRTRRRARAAARRMRFGEQARQRKRAIGRADDAHAVDRIAGNERRQLLVEA